MTRKVIFSGGLGNQMFQYAFMMGLRKAGVDVMADISLFDIGQFHNGFELSKVFGINDEFKSYNGLRLKILRIIRSLGRGYIVSTDHKTAKIPLFYKGYWQDYKYFSSISDELRKTFVFQNIDDKNKEKACVMNSVNSVSLHIRRGDYIGISKLEDICTSGYYEKAIQILSSKVKDPYFYVFSNEPEWALRLFNSFGLNFEVIDSNQGPFSYKDMYLMTQCKHHILANSSFSWWGTWLCDYPNQINIAPKQWVLGDEGVRPQIDSWILL